MKDLSTYIKEDLIFWQNEFNPDEDMLCEMSNLATSDTNLSFIVWVQCHSDGQSNGRHNLPRLKIRNSERKYIPVSIEDEPKLLGGCTLKDADISAKQFKQLQKWIRLNKQVLLDFWNEKIEGVGPLLSRLKKL